MIRSLPLLPVNISEPLMTCVNENPAQAEGLRSSALTGMDFSSTFDGETVMPAANAVATLTTIKASNPKMTS
jgi:hypothetical protein